MAFDAISSYRDTNVNWVRTQAQIMELLEHESVRDIQFSNISWETAEHGGLVMKKNTYAVMIQFFRVTVLDGGVAGKVPVRIIIPNIPTDDDRARNQVYRLLYWYLKSKFEAVKSGLVDFEQEFLPHLMIKERSGFVGTIWDMLKKPYKAFLAGGDADVFSMLPPPREERT